MASRKPTATISAGQLKGSMVICEDGTTWVLNQRDNAFSWEPGPPIPEDIEVPEEPEP